MKGHERPSGAPLIGRTESASRASLEKPCRDQISVCKIQRKGVLEREQAYAVLPSDRIRYNGHKTQEIPHEHHENFVVVWVTKYWHRLSREAAESPFLETFQSHLDTVLSNQF